MWSPTLAHYTGGSEWYSPIGHQVCPWHLSWGKCCITSSMQHKTQSWCWTHSHRLWPLSPAQCSSATGSSVRCLPQPCEYTYSGGAPWKWVWCCQATLCALQWDIVWSCDCQTTRHKTQRLWAWFQMVVSSRSPSLGKRTGLYQSPGFFKNAVQGPKHGWPWLTRMADYTSPQIKIHLTPPLM